MLAALFACSGCRSHRTAAVERCEVANIDASQIIAGRVRFMAASIPDSLPVNLFTPVASINGRAPGVPTPNLWIADYQVEHASTAASAVSAQKNEAQLSQPAAIWPRWAVYVGYVVLCLIILLIVSFRFRPSGDTPKQSF